MPFSFLHISDLHFDTESVGYGLFREQIKTLIADKDIHADCLIISGDLFNRGKLIQDEVERYKQYLKSIPGSQYTLVVPGNHDLDRSAQMKKTGSFNTYCTRKDIVLKKGKEASIQREASTQGEFSLNTEERVLLYKGAYEDFFLFSQQMKFQSFNQEPPEQNQVLYEVQQVPYMGKNDLQCSIKFVLINTGLIAGQTIRGKDYRDRQMSLKDKLEKATANGDHVEAAKIQIELAKQQQRFEDDGELVIDEEDYSEEGGGRLSLSKEGLRELSRIKATDTELTIFVGHHGYQYLSKGTKEALKTAMQNCKSGIYLCGHSHQAKYKRFKIGENTTPADIRQIQAGVMFKNFGNYTQYGFDHGVIKKKDDNSLECYITSYFLVRSASGEQHWMSEVINIPLPNIRIDTSPVTNKIKEADDSEVNNEERENKKNETSDQTTKGLPKRSDYPSISMEKGASGPLPRNRLRDNILRNGK